MRKNTLLINYLYAILYFAKQALPSRWFISNFLLNIDLREDSMGQHYTLDSVFHNYRKLAASPWSKQSLIKFYTLAYRYIVSHVGTVAITAYTSPFAHVKKNTSIENFIICNKQKFIAFYCLVFRMQPAIERGYPNSCQSSIWRASRPRRRTLLLWRLLTGGWPEPPIKMASTKYTKVYICPFSFCRIKKQQVFHKIFSQSFLATRNF